MLFMHSNAIVMMSMMMMMMMMMMMNQVRRTNQTQIPARAECQ
jgi:hypothetical protein